MLKTEVAREICSDDLSCTALLLDCTSKTITDKVLLTKDAIAEIEQISLRLIYPLHMTRKSMLTLRETSTDSVLHTNNRSSTSRRVCHHWQ